MNAADSQIVAAYETANMQPEQIADSFGYELDAVQLCLMQYSRPYQEANKLAISKGEEPLFNKSALDNARDCMTSLLYSDVDAVRARAAKFIIDEAKGRHDRATIKNLNLDVTIINDRMRKVNAAKQRALNTPTVVDVNLTPQLA